MKEEYLAPHYAAALEPMGQAISPNKALSQPFDHVVAFAVFDETD
jgi:hypothetical protein